MSAEPQIIDHAQLSGIISERPQNFAWFLGAGASSPAGLPTATDIIWDLKRRYYCQQENEEISRQDVRFCRKFFMAVDSDMIAGNASSGRAR
jgi:hypothetical protein